MSWLISRPELRDVLRRVNNRADSDPTSRRYVLIEGKHLANLTPTSVEMMGVRAPLRLEQMVQFKGALYVGAEHLRERT